MRMWHRSPIIAAIFIVALGVLAGCSQHDAPVAPSTVPGVNWSEAAAPFQLSFQSRSYDPENDETTFLYQLGALDLTTGELNTSELPVIHTFLSVMVELPACAPAPSNVSPPNGATIYTHLNGVYGVEWGVGYDDNPEFLYSVTFPGNIAEGVVRSIVTTGGASYVQNIGGPCEGGHQVTGTVFVDGDGDGEQDGNELGVPDVTVRLDGTEGDQTFKTDADGNYLFIAATGSYTVIIDETTADNTDYNELLYLYWNATSATSLPVTVGPDATNKDFGWEPDVDGITALLEEGDLPTDGKSYKWWRKEFFRALNGTEPTTYTAEELLEFVHQIEDMALLDEYDFTPGQELQQVHDILNNHYFEDGDGESIENPGKRPNQGNHDAYQFLVRELLTTELNHVSGRGLTDKQLQWILVAWGEIILNNNAPGGDDFKLLPGGPSNSNTGDGPQRIIESPIEAGGKIFRGLNGATGGGGTGG